MRSPVPGGANRMEQNAADDFKEDLRGSYLEELKDKVLQLNLLREKMVIHETVLKSMIREIDGLEAVISYIRSKVR